MNCPTCNNPMDASAALVVMDTRCMTARGRVADCACTGAVRLRCPRCRAEMIAPSAALTGGRYVVVKEAA